MTQLDSSPETSTWLDVARRCEYATFFHTPIWSELVTRTFPDLRDATRHATSQDGVSRRASAHGGGATPRRSARRSRTPLPWVLRGPDRRRAGRRSRRENTSTGAALRSGIVELELTQNPLSPFPPPRFRAVGVREDFTDVLPLAEGCRPSPHASRASAAGRSRREGSRAYERGSRRRWTTIGATSWRIRTRFSAGGNASRCVTRGSSSRSATILRDRYPEHVKLWLAEREGETARRRLELLLEPTRRRLAFSGVRPCARFVRPRDPGRRCGRGGLRPRFHVVRPQPERRAGGSRSLQEPIRWRAQAYRACPLPDLAAPVRRPREERSQPER